jgi:anti-sigma-K factor RskA
VNTLSEPQHSDITELLPDYAIGALEDGDLWRVEAHLETCAQCLATFDQLLELVGVLSPVTAPGASVKLALFARSGLPLAAPVVSVPAHDPEQAPPTTTSEPRTLPQRRVHPALVTLVAAGFLLLALGGAWSVLQQQELDDQREFVALLTDPDAAHPLTDSEVDTDASATFYSDPERDQGLLVGQDFPALENHQRYQIWLFTQSGERVDGGLFTPDENGGVVEVIELFSDYWAVGVSVEPVNGSDAPTSPLILGGWIQ